MSHPLRLVAKTMAGLEPVLEAELRDLGAAEVEVGRRMVMFAGDREMLYRANIHCRTAIRVLQWLTTFPTTQERELYAGIQQVDWPQYLLPDGTLAIDPIVHSSFLTHSLFAAQLAKDAIVDQFRDRFGRRPSVDRDNPDLRINLHLNENQASVYLDASGDSLHKRGYRRATGEAPLSEVLAAGILMLSGWDRQSPLVDFMCGSGTFVIEGALLARNIAPGLLRPEFGYQRWPDYDGALHNRLLDIAQTAQRGHVAFPIVGSDLDEAVIGMARENARRADVGDDIQFQVANFADVQPPAEEGMLVCNPPYDERLKVAWIEKVYARLGEVLKHNWPGWRAFIFTGNPTAAKQIELKPSRKMPLRNGPIECRLLEYVIRRRGPAYTAPSNALRAAPNMDATTTEFEEQGADLQGRSPDADHHENDIDPAESGKDVSSTSSESATLDPSLPPRRTWDDQAAQFRNRLARMAKHWAKWARRQGITCYRIYDRDVPEIPLIIDWYDGHLAIAEYDRPHDRTDVEQRLWLEHMAGVVGEVLGVERRKIFLKMRQRQRGDSQYEKQAGEQYTIEVQEAGHRFEVNLSDYLDTGLFLDHRLTRAMVEKEAAGKRFLNLFAYTGAFTVYAAAGGATSSVTLDLSNTYLEWAQRNLQLNRLAKPEHEFVRDDARGYLLHYGRRQQPPFDLAVVDPPTFSASKRTDLDWDVQRDHVQLLDLVLRNLRPGGKIFFSTNFRRFKFQGEELLNVSCREISRQTVPPDFRNQRIHRCWTIIRQK